MKVRWIDSISVRLAIYAGISMLLTMVTDFILLFLLAYIRGRNLLQISIHSLEGVNQSVSVKSVHNSRQFIDILRITNQNVWNIVIILVMTILLFLLYYILITRPIVDEIRALLAGLHVMEKGDLTVHFPIYSNDELGQLAIALNKVQYTISQIHRQERKLEHTKDELITNVAHDLRTPLTSLKGYVDLLEKEDLTSEQREKYTRILSSKSDQLQGLIEALFEYTKYYGGEVQFHMQPINMSCFMEQITDEFYPDFCNAGLRCESHIVKDLYALGDGEKLARAFNNIFSNAVKYGKDGKLIQVNVREGEEEDEPSIIIEIINYGTIIEEKDISRLFEKFYRVEESRSLNTGGSGLGLAITKTIVERHRGKVSAASGEDGTVIRVVLPEIRKERNDETMDSMEKSEY